MPKYDRELIARMLLGPRVYSPESVAEQARLLREAENLEADARTVVRDVPDGMEELREKIEALQEFKPWAHKHPHSGKGFVTNMRKSKPPEQGEEYGWVNKGTILALLSAASGEGVDDTKRLDWIARQGGYEFDFGILNDQPGDGDWFVHGMGGSGQGATFRDAIDAAIKEEAGGQDANTDILDTLAFKTENGDAGRGSVTYIALVASGEADHQQNAAQGGGNHG